MFGCCGLRVVIAYFVFCFSMIAGAQQGGGVVRGVVADPDNAVIQGATVTLTAGSSKAQIVKTGGDGAYVFPSVASGSYSLTVTMIGFASFVKQSLEVRAGQSVTINARMAIQAQDQTVTVTATSNAVSVDQDSNASATVIKGKDLDALSDDPDELSAELSALAGPAAGPEGGQIYVDGFTGGQLPPKSSIREIRVNQNPFSAQYEKLGYGRVEVFTKPGTDKFHGSAQLQGNDSSFNNVTPLLNQFLQAGQTPVRAQPYHSIFFLGNLTGPLSHSASFSASVSRRTTEDNTLYNGSILSRDGTLAGLCRPGVTGCSLTPYSVTNSFPQVRLDIDPRLDFALGEKNTLTTRFQVSKSSSTNDGVGGFDLPQTGYDASGSEYELQISDTQILSARVINETRLELGRNRDSQKAQSTAPTVTLTGNFSSGGSSQGNNTDHQARLELQNYTSVQLAKNFVRAGGRLRLNRETSFTGSGSNGFFSYATAADYMANRPFQFSITRNNTAVRATFADVGLYLEDDWKARPNVTVSYGFRYEAQNFVAGHHDFAPRVSVAYGLGGAKGNPKTVLRAGFGMFYDHFGRYNTLTTLRENGTNQQQTLLRGPFRGTCSPDQMDGCVAANGAGDGTNNVVYLEDPALRRPYTMQFAIGVDRELFKGANMSVNFLHAHGVHEFFSANLTAGTARVTKQFESGGKFNQNQMIVNFNVRAASRFSLFGYYSLNFADSNTSGAGFFATQPGNLNADYGRASFATRSRLFMGGSATLPYRIALNPFLVAQSGNPYSITTGIDNNGDSIVNDRPSFTNGVSGNCLDKASFTSTPGASNANEIPINYCTGPALFTLNVRIGRTFGFGAETGKPKDGAGDAPRAGAFGQAQRGGRGMPNGGASSGRRYNVTLSALIANLFNVSNLGLPNGVLTSQQFGRSTTLAGNIYTSNSAVRRIYLQANFSF